MKLPLVSPTNLSIVDFTKLLQQCLKSKALKSCKQVHSVMLASCVNMNHLSLNSRLVAVYASCTDFRSAELMLQQTKSPNVFAFNWMISASAFNGLYEQAIGYFSSLLESKNVPNAHTFAFVLQACVGLMDVKKGKEVHAVLDKMGFGSVFCVVNHLIDMYWKCGNIRYARHLFDKMPERDIACYTSMICGYFSMGNTDESLTLFNRMILEEIEPNEFTWNAMVAGFARAGHIDEAFSFFNGMRNEGFILETITWNAIISGFAQSNRNREALRLFQDMLDAGVYPNESTITGILPVFGIMGSIQKAKEIHSLVYRFGINMNAFICTGLIDIYSKCGSVKDSWNIFKSTPFKNITAWNAMIGCYGKNGDFNSAINLFEKMKYEGIRPNQVTLVCVLSACSHGGLIEKGLMFFRLMKESYEVEKTEEHYACIIDLLCRCGRLEEAYEFIKEMKFDATDSMVGAFFNGCKVHNRRDMAKKMGKVMLSTGTKRAGVFVTLSNIYAEDGEWKEVENLRKVMKEIGVHKKPGSSWVEKG